MTKKHFIRMAAMVRAILAGHWTNELPTWADFDNSCGDDNPDAHHLRAIQTAEFCILLAREENPRFDEQRFLVACGLAESPKKGKR